MKSASSEASFTELNVFRTYVKFRMRSTSPPMRPGHWRNLRLNIAGVVTPRSYAPTSLARHKYRSSAHRDAARKTFVKNACRVFHSNPPFQTLP